MIGHVMVRLVLVWLLLAGAASAHDLGAIEARLTEEPGNQYTLTAVIPVVLANLVSAPVLPNRCRFTDDPLARQGQAGIRFVFACGDSPLHSDDTLILPWKRDGILLSAHWRDGTIATNFFIATGGSIPIQLAALQAGSGSFGDAAWRFTTLGVEHILFGIDHLLFIFGLLLIVNGTWALLKTITAFTIAHSVTLGLATLGLVQVPSAPVEAAIALSIVLVAAEGVRDRPRGLASACPWLMAFAFGLLHVFGFAGALAELGLPSREIPVALLFFNVGVEIGQIMFVLMVLSIRHGLQRLTIPWPRRLSALPGYVVGTVAMLWFIERVAAIVAV